MKKIQIFPTPLHFFDLSDTKEFKACKSELLRVSIEDCLEQDLATTTDDRLHLRSPYKELSELILEKAKEVFDDLGLVRETEKVVCMWSNISRSENKHMVHLHANSYYSVVLYLNCPQPDPGRFGVKDPRPGLMTTFYEYDKDNDLSSRTIDILPEDGLLIFFPSWLEHGVQEGNFSNTERRISLSCNIMPVTNVTDFTHRYYYK